MQTPERRRPRPRPRAPLEPPPAAPASDPPPPARVRIVAGAFDEPMAVVGMTVNAVLQMLLPDHPVGHGAFALVDGQAVRGTHRLLAGQTLQLTPLVGQKGARP